MKQVQFSITDPAVDVPPMAFPNDEARQATLDYVLDEAGIGLDDLALIVFSAVDDDGELVLEKVLQRGKDITSSSRLVKEA